MEIRTNITIDHLTTESVSVKEQRILVDGDTELTLGEPVRTAYIKEDADALKSNVPEPFLTAILDVWGISVQEESEVPQDE
ncbi:MAG: hypothetical protein VZR73_17585 [Acutalibacteraceae bacterium]|nr:hypothetical protein [Acutalibacteraceae bacterium]